MTLQNFLLAILTGSFAVGPAVYMLLERLAAFARLDSEWKRWIVAGVSAMAGLGAWGLALWFGYGEQPPAYTPEYVGSGVWHYGILVGYSWFTSATLIHGQTSLKKS